MCDFDEDSMPTPCSCGKVVDQSDMNPCGECNTLFCDKCVESPHDNCKECDPLGDGMDSSTRSSNDEYHKWAINNGFNEDMDRYEDGELAWNAAIANSKP